MGDASCCTAPHPNAPWHTGRVFEFACEFNFRVGSNRLRFGHTKCRLNVEGLSLATSAQGGGHGVARFFGGMCLGACVGAKVFVVFLNVDEGIGVGRVHD